MLSVKRPAAAGGGGGTRLPRNPSSAAQGHAGRLRSSPGFGTYMHMYSILCLHIGGYGVHTYTAALLRALFTHVRSHGQLSAPNCHHKRESMSQLEIRAHYSVCHRVAPLLDGLDLHPVPVSCSVSSRRFVYVANL